MPTPSDMEIMAYADGELDAESARTVEAALARSPEARARLRQYVESAAMARAAFGHVAHEPAPERLLRALHRPKAPAWYRAALPMAASLAALAVGVGLGVGLKAPAPTPAERQLAAHVERALETRLSGERIEVRIGSGGVLAVEPLRTFRATDGRYCREYREVIAMPRGGSRVRYGIACRDRDGWRPVLSIQPNDTGKEL